MNSPWTDEMVEKLHQLVSAGFSVSRIAEEMGISHNSVSCKMERIGLRSSGSSRPNSPWTDDAVGKLKEFLKKGFSASRIAEEIGGITRMSVIGKATRMGLQFARIQMGTGPRPERKRKPKQRRHFRSGGVIPRQAALADETEPLPDLTTTAPFPREGSDQCAWYEQCAWPAGKGLCCGRRVELGTSWCRAHMRIVFYGPSRHARKPQTAGTDLNSPALVPREADDRGGVILAASREPRKTARPSK